MGRKKEGFTEVPVYLPDDIYGPLGEALKKEGKTIGAWLSELAVRTWQEKLYVQVVRTDQEVARTTARTDEQATPAGDNSVRTAANEFVNNELTTPKPTQTHILKTDEEGARYRVLKCEEDDCEKRANGGEMDGKKRCVEHHLEYLHAHPEKLPPVETTDATKRPVLALPPCEVCRNRRYLLKDGGKGVAVAEKCACLKCPHCEKTPGFVWVASAPGYPPSQEKCDCYKHIRGRLSFNAAQLPALYVARMTGPVAWPPGYEPTESQRSAQAIIETWAKNYMTGGRGLVLTGPYGTGKTALLCRALAYLTLAKGVLCRFVEWGLLLESIKESFDEEETANPLAALYTIPVLALDELGRHLATEWQTSQLDHLLQARYQGKLPTLYSTNFTQRQLKERIGERLFERLIERCEFVEVQGKSLRRFDLN